MKRIIRFVNHKFKKAINDFHFYWPEFLLGYRTKQFILHNMDDIDWNGVVFREDLNTNLNLFMSKEDLDSAEIVKNVTVDIVKCYIAYGITPDEYFLHDFRKKNKRYRESVLSRKRKDEICIKLLGQGWKASFNQLKDKWAFYSLTKPFFQRDVVRVDSTADYNEIAQFCSVHSVFIAKPRKSSSGIGIHKVVLSEWESTDKLFEHYCNLDGGEWIFEELIIQDSTMSSWHPSSVNTIRIPSVMTSDGPVVLLPLFRTGKNGNLVDNCHNDGGLMAVPDAKTGIIITEGYDIYTNVWEFHPNSGIKFKGYQIPRWKELINLAEEVHKSLPSQHKYVGFDFALTSKGWVLVEGNWGNFPHQVCAGYGIRKEFERLMRS